MIVSGTGAGVSAAAVFYRQQSASKPQADSAASTPASDTATFSEAAIALSAGNSSTAAGGANGASSAAQADASIQQFAEQFASSIDLPLEDITPLVNGTGAATYVATGQPVTPESQAAFTAEATQLRQGRMALYQSETASGTPPKQIMSDLISYMNDHASAGYKTLMNWSGVSHMLTSTVSNLESSAA